MATFIVVPSPERQMDMAIDRNDWLSAFAVAVGYFEYYGAEILKKRYKSLGIPELRRTVEELRVGTMAFVLRLLKIVEIDTYSKMRRIIKERNKLVHPTRRGPAYGARKERDTAIGILDDARECLRVLREAIKASKP